jgi:aspartate-semialdehyde dehydrogenase
MGRKRALHVGVVGATGMVGREFLVLLQRRAFPLASLRLFGSARSAGQRMPFRAPNARDGDGILVEDLAAARPGKLDVVFFSAGSGVAREHAPRFTEAGAVVIDNSSAFREEAAVPLVVPEINSDSLGSANLIANPNCSTIIMLLPLACLHRAFGLDEVVVSTYQAVSGAGRAALEDLVGQARSFARGEPERCRHYDRPIFMNLIPFIGDAAPEGECAEERKMRTESWRILGDDSFPIYATTVRVPVERCHSESLWVRVGRPVSREDVLAQFAGAAGITLGELPTPRELACSEAVHVGRVRVAARDPRVVRFWVVSDQLWKGAALNAIQIAEELIRRGRWPA